MSHLQPDDRFEFDVAPSQSFYSAEHTPHRQPSPIPTESVTPPDNVDDIAPTPPPTRPFASNNPFSANATPLGTSANSSAIQLQYQKQSQKYFRSRRIKKGTLEQPWKTKKDPKEKWVTIIPLIGLALGFALAGFLVYNGLSTIIHHTYDLVLDEDWSNGFNEAVWTKEVNIGGFG